MQRGNSDNLSARVLLRKCRAIWQIAQWTIYKIVLQVFIHLGAPKAHGELLRK
ncbi:MAG: hypothetical protein V9G20_24940 [Candidatus Promineifilaceae bacterium]